jgi:hypothetical protein
MSEGESRTLPLDRSDYSLSASWANYFLSTNNPIRRYRKLKGTL